MFRPTITPSTRSVPGALLASPDPAQLVLAAHNLLAQELLNTSPTGNSPDGPMSGGFIAVPPRGKTFTHVHPKAWAYIILLTCGAEGAITQLGPDMDHALVQFAWQMVRIEPGVEHRAINLSDTEWVAAIELTDSESIFSGRELLPHLDEIPVPDLHIPDRPSLDLAAIHANRATR